MMTSRASLNQGMASSWFKFQLVALFAGGLVTVASAASLAHGESELGPHGGYIRMPGAFHTEVKVEGASAVAVYLLDINFKNPIVDESNVAVVHRQGKVETKLECSPVRTSFQCRVPSQTLKGVSLNKGVLIVKAKRAGLQGNEALYELPLRLEKPSHSGHHH